MSNYMEVMAEARGYVKGAGDCWFDLREELKRMRLVLPDTPQRDAYLKALEVCVSMAWNRYQEYRDDFIASYGESQLEEE